MKILNLYVGIGGNRKLWGDEYEITAFKEIQQILTKSEVKHQGVVGK